MRSDEKKIRELALELEKELISVCEDFIKRQKVDFLAINSLQNGTRDFYIANLIAICRATNSRRYARFT